MEIDCVSADESPPPQGPNKDAGGRRRREAPGGKKLHWKIGRKSKSQSDKTEGHIEEDNIVHKGFFQGNLVDDFDITDLH
eukprot:CAMPEP_0203668200 /NCGR_PEP_ID=MMETSP0090-20130426/4893_1 /ASSEMBLY_ACC=CAM_ASM_001088 /TAXON_ID=426623 /ORGANISM="Chaetoceros affinis, Strain CCMP159" /LENGTH=79 /DNA_ID=CAMNT_0050532573 /DNA_START=149 /DNA_END=388 /DNA_ORIENTATION=-